MKRSTDWQAQQYRIRHEQAQRRAVEAWDRAFAEHQRQHDTDLAAALRNPMSRLNLDPEWREMWIGQDDNTPKH